MADEEQLAPIIIKKVKATGHSAHHGGAWKVAYADFVTAMMAFFLLLWLLNATTEEQKLGISNYFSPDSVSQSRSGSGGVLGGTTISIKGVLTSNGGPQESAALAPPAQSAGEDSDEDYGGESEFRSPGGDADGDEFGGESDAAELGGESDEDPSGISEKNLEELLAEREQKQFEEAEQALRQAIEEVPELAQFAENLIIDQTPEGLRIQLVDQERYSMFPIGSAKPNEQTRQLVNKVAQAVARLPNRISVSGHTDARPYRTDDGYSNWELSADRANAARRLLTDSGLSGQRIALVQGRADTEPLIPDDPLSARNRRISIVLLRENQPGTVRANASGAPGEADGTESTPARATTPAPRRAPERDPAPVPDVFDREDAVPERAAVPAGARHGRTPG